VWVDSKTGAYRPQLRRAVDCESTWRGFPVLDHDRVNLMIEECDTDCGHQTRSADTPFNVFSLSDRFSLSTQVLLASSQPLSKHEAQEKMLFQHYVKHVAYLMIAIDGGGRNPWRSTYPAIALRDSTPSTKALYYAMLAQAAFNLANLYGNRNDLQEQGMKYYGLALHDLRKSLEGSTYSYDSCTAALITLVMAEVCAETRCSNSEN